MSFKTALYSAIGNGCAKMAVLNPEYWDEDDDEFDVEPTVSVKKILDWMSQVDDLPIVVFFDDHGVKLGTWVILNDYGCEDEWFSDADVGDWTKRVTDGHY